MKRILLVLTVGLVMAAMLVATAVPAFAARNDCSNTGTSESTCGGSGSKGGSGLFNGRFERTSDSITFQGGSGGSGGGSGGRVVATSSPDSLSCKGSICSTFP